MKVVELYNMALKAVAEGHGDFDVVVSDVSLVPDEENIGENFTVVLDKHIRMLHINEDSKEFRIFESEHTNDELDAYERMCVNDIN